jgi:hypothetical protein
MTNKEADADAANAAEHTDAVANAENAVVKDTEDAVKDTEGAENAVVVVGVGDKRAGEEGEEDAMDLTYLVLLEVASYLCF